MKVGGKWDSKLMKSIVEQACGDAMLKEICIKPPTMWDWLLPWKARKWQRQAVNRLVAFARVSHPNPFVEGFAANSDEERQEAFDKYIARIEGGLNETDL